MQCAGSRTWVARTIAQSSDVYQALRATTGFPDGVATEDVFAPRAREAEIYVSRRAAVPDKDNTYAVAVRWWLGTIVTWFGA